MSITNIKTCYNMLAALEYQQFKDGKDRCAAKRNNIEPFNFYNFARAAIDVGRKVQGFTIIQAFSPEELQNTPENVELANLIGCELAARAFSGCPYQVITHNDSKTSHLHNHISVLNYDLETGKCINRDSRWLTVSRINDALMQDYGMEICNAKTRRADQKLYFDRQRNPNKYIWQEDIQERVERALNHAISPKDFASRLKSEGVTAKIYGKNGKPLKHMVFIFKGNDGKEHRKRGSNMNIDNGFTYTELTEKFAENAANENGLALSEDITPTEEAFAPKKITKVKPEGTKIHSKAIEKPKDTDSSVIISKRKKKKMIDEAERRKRLQIQLSVVQSKRQAKKVEMDDIQEELDNINEAIEKTENEKQAEWLEEKEKQLQRQLKDLQEEYLKLNTKEKDIRMYLSGEPITLNPQLEMGYEINKVRQKQRDSDDISLG